MNHTKLLNKMKDGERLMYARFPGTYPEENCNHQEAEVLGTAYLRSSIIYAMENVDHPETIHHYARMLGIFSQRELSILDTHFDISEPTITHAHAHDT